jgi:hypothetical protein
MICPLSLLLEEYISSFILPSLVIKTSCKTYEDEMSHTLTQALREVYKHGIGKQNCIPFAATRLVSDILGHSGADTPSIHWGCAVRSHQGTISCQTPASWARSVNHWWVVMTCRRFYFGQSSGFHSKTCTQSITIVGVKRNDAQIPVCGPRGVSVLTREAIPTS